VVDNELCLYVCQDGKAEGQEEGSFHDGVIGGSILGVAGHACGNNADVVSVEVEDFGEGDAHGFVGGVCIHDIGHVCPPALHDGLCGECIHGFGVGGFEDAEE
jgi:hypothetical protein